MSLTSSALRRRCLTYLVALFVALWVTKPLTTGFTEWVPTLLAHVAMAGFVAVLCLGLWLADRSQPSRPGSHVIRTRGFPDGFEPPSASLSDEYPLFPEALLSGYAVSARVLPRDERDPFCTCPKCELLGTHPVRVTVFESRWAEGQDGDRVMIPLMIDPPDGTPRAERTCVFCGYIWHTEAA